MADWPRRGLLVVEIVDLVQGKKKYNKQVNKGTWQEDQVWPNEQCGVKILRYFKNKWVGELVSELASEWVHALEWVSKWVSQSVTLWASG